MSTKGQIGQSASKQSSVPTGLSSTINPDNNVSIVTKLDNAGHFKSFDTTTALAGLYLWLLFGFFTSLLGCDLQRVMTNNIFIKHLMALVTFFFLMSVVDTNNNISIGLTWLKTIIVYLIFMISIKSKIYTAAIFLILLIIDQSIKVQMTYLQANGGTQAQIDKYNEVRYYILVLLIITAIIGFILYFVKQYNDHYEDFSFITFFFGNNKCDGL